MKQYLFGLAAAIAASVTALAATPASACGSTAPYLATYQFDQTYGVTAIAKYNSSGDCGSSITNSDTAPIGPSIVTDVFAKQDPVLRALLFGLTSDLPGDEAGQQHLVLFTNDVFAARAENIAFGSLFPETKEATLIAALTSLASGNGGGSDYDVLYDFAENAALNGPNGDAGFGLNQRFTSVAFSDGRIIGTGLFFATPVAAAVPEPATWALLLLGFGGVGVALRRRHPMRQQLA